MLGDSRALNLYGMGPQAESGADVSDWKAETIFPDALNVNSFDDKVPKLAGEIKHCP